MLEYVDAMSSARRGLSWGVCLVALFAVGALVTEVGHCPPPAPAVAAVPEPPAPAPVPQPDPVADVIAISEQHFENGRKELEAGHLDTAKTAFNRSLEILLEWPGGARSEPRIREQFDRLVERISAYEVTALAQGDGFAEKASEPASIDDLLAISTFEPPRLPPGDRAGRGPGSRGRGPRHRHPAERPGAVVRGAVHADG